MIAKIFFLLNASLLFTAILLLPRAWRRLELPAVKPLLLLVCDIALVSMLHAANFLFDYTFDPVIVEQLITSLSIISILTWVWTMIEFILERHFKYYPIFLIYPLIVIGFLWTNDLHGLFYTEVSEVVRGGIPRAVLVYGPLRKVHSLIVISAWFGTTIWGFYRYLKKPKGSNRWVFIILFFAIFGALERYLYSIGYLPFALSTLTGILVAFFGIQYYRLLDILPMARKQVVETLSDGIAIINIDDEIVDFNLSFKRLVGIDLPIKKPFAKLGDLPIEFAPILNQKDNSEMIRANVTLEGATLACDFSILKNNDKHQGHTLVVRDITEAANLLKQKEFYTQQLEVSKTELERLDQMKSNFFSNVTHEFRTPLTLIQEPARVLLHHSEDSVRSHARLISKNSDKLLSLVNELLTLTRMDSGKVEVKMEVGDLTEVVREEFQKFLPKAASEGLEIKLNIEDGFPLILFDRQKIESIISNLLSNAIKYTDEGSILVSMGKVVGSKNKYYIEVEDSGKGIPEEDIERVFDRFYQVDGSNTRKGEGTGIGLALTQQLVRLMEGEISVKSTLDKGSTFKVTLPIKISEANQIPDTANHENGKMKRVSFPEITNSSLNEGGEDANINHVSDKWTALIVEDNLELREFVKNGLKSSFQVIAAANGVEGIEKAREFLPDIVISDVMMPEKDGITMLQELKSDSLTSHIPIILLTAKSSVEDRLEGISGGADQYLTKPFRMDELIIRSNNLIDNRIRATRRYIEEQHGQTQSASTNVSPQHEFIKKLVLIIEAELSNDSILIDDYAAQLFISRTQLHRKIKSLTGQSTSEFIRNYRLDKAMIMLKQNEGNVAQIAGKVGFSNDKYFSTSFKKKFGVSPSQV